MAQQTLQRDGYTTAYVDQGKGRPIILLPGGSLNISYLAPLAERLTDGGLRVIRIGSRRSPENPAALVLMQDLAADVLAVMTHLELPSAWVAGHAFGNRVARTVALDAPDRTAGVILLAAGGTVQPSENAARALRVAFSDVPESEAVASMQYMVGDPDNGQAAWDAVKKARSPELGAMQRNAVIKTPQKEWASLVPGKPALIIQGSDDQIAPPANGEELARSYPGQVTLVSIQGGGHLFPIFHRDEVTKAIVHHIAT